MIKFNTAIIFFSIITWRYLHPMICYSLDLDKDWGSVPFILKWNWLQYKISNLRIRDKIMLYQHSIFLLKPICWYSLKMWFDTRNPMACALKGVFETYDIDSIWFLDSRSLFHQNLVSAIIHNTAQHDPS